MVAVRDNLPENIEELQSLVLVITEERDHYKQVAEEYRRMLFAPRSEKLQLGDTAQSRLFDEAESVVQAESAVTVKAHERNKSKKKKERRPTIPEGLPFEEIKHEVSPEDRVCPCCEEVMTKIGEDVRPELHVIPEQLIVHKHIHPRYACSRCKDDSTAVTAKRNRLLPGTIVGSGLLAFILQRKFQFGLPLYRISAMFKAFHVEISRQSMSNWIVSAGAKLKPIYDLIKTELLDSKVLGIDETTFQVLNEENRKNTQKSFMWEIRGSPRDGPLIIFEYREGRSTDFLFPFLKGYKGVILTDGWKSYDTLAMSLNLNHAGCWSHARRYFHKTYLENKTDKNTLEFLGNIRILFKLEIIYDQFNPSVDKRSIWRQRFSKPVIENINKSLKELESRIRPKSSLGKAISYTLGQWSKLTLFLDRGEVMIHNNDVERGIRPFVIGRNYADIYIMRSSPAKAA